MPEPTRPAGYEFPFLLLGAFRRVIDDLHVRLAAQGHPELRPAHAVAMRSIGPDGTRISDMAMHLAVSRQAVAKSVDRLVSMGYVTREVDAADRRARIVRISPRGVDAMERSGRILNELLQEYEAEFGQQRIDTVWGVLNGLRGETDAFTRLTGWYGET